MYIKGVKSLYKYREESRRKNILLISISIISILFISSLISLKGVELMYIYTQSNYILEAKSIEQKKVVNRSIEVSQENPNKIFYDEEFYAAEKIDIQDKRIYILDKYFEANNSPLQGHAREFVDACDRFGAPKDCISLVAIAKHETNLCKYYASDDMKNCIGWGGGGIYRMKFNTYKEMIDTATNVLVNQYGIEYMEDPTKMEKVFCGPQDECIGWGNRVKIIMDSINNFGESLGVGKLR